MNSTKLLTCAGGLMALSGILMAVTQGLLPGIALWAASGYLFAAALFSRTEKGETK